MSKLVKNQSKGYGYKYSSLADFHRAGIEIPKMRTKATEFGEYIEYFDGTEWQQGAKVVEMEMKGMNPAQAYGSAVTYARRYTVALAQEIATDDDDAVESDKTAVKRVDINAKPTDKQIEYAKRLAYDAGCETVEAFEKLFFEQTDRVLTEARSCDYSRFISAMKEFSND